MAQIQQEAMRREPILMPSHMINKIAQDRKVSFAEVVREAVDAFDENQRMPSFWRRWQIL